MSSCRACSSTSRPRIPKNDLGRNEMGQFGFKRQESRQLASKLRYSVLKHIDSPESDPSVTDPGVASSTIPGKTECFHEKQYKILEMFEGDEMDKKLADLSLEDLENIVTQENKDISCALTMAKKNNVDVSSKHRDGKYICRRVNGDILSRVCDTDEDISADVVAKMLHAAEVKSALTAPPQVIYNLLFDDAEYEPLAVNTAAYDTHLSDVVVPLAPPVNFETDLDLKEAARLDATGKYTDDSSQCSETDIDNLQDKIIRKVLNLTNEADTLEELLLGPKQNISNDLSATLSDFEFMIEPEDSKYQSLFQLRGSVEPSWFPDCYAIFPDSPHGQFEMIESPMSVLERAWEHVQPAELKPTDGIRMIGL